MVIKLKTNINPRMKKTILTPEKIHEVVGLAWADEVSFDAIKQEVGLSEREVIALMRSNLKSGSFKVWRERVSGRKAKHQTRLRPKSDSRLAAPIFEGEE